MYSNKCKACEICRQINLTDAGAFIIFIRLQDVVKQFSKGNLVTSPKLLISLTVSEDKLTPKCDMHKIKPNNCCHI